MSHTLRTLWRKAKAAITGRKPCSYTSQHQHELEWKGSIGRGKPWHTAFFQCEKCGLVATKDQYTPWLEVQESDWTPEQNRKPDPVPDVEQLQAMEKEFDDFLFRMETAKTEFCTYPECRCPFDMGADFMCLKGLSCA